MEPTIQTTPIVYGGFRKRLLAALVDMGFGIFVVPTIVSIYYYFAEGQTLGYKVVGLKIFRSDEVSKPGFWRLLARWIVKGAGGVVIVGILWFIANLIFWVLGTIVNAQHDDGNCAMGANCMTHFPTESTLKLQESEAGGLLLGFKRLVNRLLGLLSLLSLFGMGIMPLSIIWNHKKRGRHDQIVDTTVLQVSNTQTAWAVVGVVLFVGGIILNVLVRLGAGQ